MSVSVYVRAQVCVCMSVCPSVSFLYKDIDILGRKAMHVGMNGPSDQRQAVSRPDGAMLMQLAVLGERDLSFPWEHSPLGQ